MQCSVCLHLIGVKYNFFKIYMIYMYLLVLQPANHLDRHVIYTGGFRMFDGRGQK